MLRVQTLLYNREPQVSLEDQIYSHRTSGVWFRVLCRLLLNVNYWVLVEPLCIMSRRILFGTEHPCVYRVHQILDGLSLFGRVRFAYPKA